MFLKEIRILQLFLKKDVNFSISLRDRSVSFWMFVFFKPFLWDCFYPRLAKSIKNCWKHIQKLINILSINYQNI